MTEIRDIARSEANPAATALLEGQDAAGGASSSFNLSITNLEKPMVLVTGADPVSTPDFIGQRHVNTVTGGIFIATGTTNSSDWQQLSSYFDTKAALEALLSDVNDLAEADGDTYSGTHDFSGATVDLPPNSVNNTELTDMLSNTIKGRIAGGTGDPEDLSAAQARTVLNVEDGANNYSHPNHTGDVTSVGDGAQTIANDAVSNSKLANMSGDTIKGRQSTTGDPTDLTPAQVRAIINVEDGATGDQSAAEIEAIVSHDNLQGVDANQHIDWTTDQGATNIDPDNVPDGADATAIHDNVSGEINLITEKVSPDGTDLIVIEDSAAANAKKKVQIGNLPTGGGGEANVGGNVGTGADLYRDKTGVTLNMRGINGTAGIGAAVNGDNVDLSGDHNALSNYSANQHVPAGLGAVFDGGGSVLTDTVYIEVVAPFTGTIDVGTLLADQVGSVTVTVEKAAYASWPSLSTLGTLTLSSAQKSQNSGISWSVTAGEIVRFTLSGVATITKLTADLYFIKS